MSKLKTVKGVKGRFKVTGTGKVLGSRAGKRHLMGHKAAKIKRHMRHARRISGSDERQIRALIPYA